MRHVWLDELADELTRETPEENIARYIRWVLDDGPDRGDRPELSQEGRARFNFTDMVREVELSQDGQN